MDIHSHIYLPINDKSVPFSHLRVLVSHLSVGITENGYPFSDNRTLNCIGVAPSHIKGGETAMRYPFKLTRCTPPTKIPNWNLYEAIITF